MKDRNGDADERMQEEERKLYKVDKHTGSLDMFLDTDLFNRNMEFIQTKL